MFNFSHIRSEVADYTFGTDSEVQAICDLLYQLNPDAQSVDDFEYSVFYDVLMEVYKGEF